MKFLTTTLPDDSADLGIWLDEVVARGQAARLADELSAVRGTRVGVVEVPADLKEVVARQGFTGLAENQLSTVMADPKLLTALAEAALASAGSFWTHRVGEESTFDGRAERLRAELFATDSVTPAKKADRSRTSFAPWVASLATAAVLLLAFYLVPGFRDVFGPVKKPAVATAGWGWQKADELERIANPAEYLTRIADFANEWSAQDTSTPRALADRIAEFRQGCARLQLLDHKPLSDAQRTDLLARCQKWAKKFDQNLAELETTGDDAKVRAAMTETVAQLTAVLRDQAAKARAA